MKKILVILRLKKTVSIVIQILDVIACRLGNEVGLLVLGVLDKKIALAELVLEISDVLLGVNMLRKKILTEIG